MIEKTLSFEEQVELAKVIGSLSALAVVTEADISAELEKQITVLKYILYKEVKNEN